MNYHPEGMQMWDAWFCTKGDTVHAFHLQRLRANSARSVTESDGIGHAVSKDLVHWEERPMAILPGEQGGLEDMGLFTGCTVGDGERYYTFYTMRSTREAGRVQRTGVAISSDDALDRWEKYAGNPVIVPDSRYYCSPDAPALYGTVDCRDLCVVESPDGKGYYGFYAARLPAEEMPEGAAIACCYSEDLLHWTQLPPAFRAERFSIVEVPEVFLLGGKWYMLMLCNNEYGNRDIFPEEPRLTMGTIYAVADSIQGPYRLQEDYILMASESYNGISCRTLLFQGERMALYTSADRGLPYDSFPPCMGVLSTPKKLEVRDGCLRMVYSSLIETDRREQLLEAGTPIHIGRLPYETPGSWWVDGRTITGSVRTAWARHTFAATARSFLYRANVRIDSGAGAGLVFKASPEGYGGCVAMLNPGIGEVQLLRLPNLAILESRKMPLEYGVSYDVRVVSKDQYLEVFVNDVLMLQCVHYAARQGHLGLMVDRGEAAFIQPEAYRLDCPEED